jgi:hypothetical protein
MCPFISHGPANIIGHGQTIKYLTPALWIEDNWTTHCCAALQQLSQANLHKVASILHEANGAEDLSKQVCQG